MLSQAFLLQTLKNWVLEALAVFWATFAFGNCFLPFFFSLRHIAAEGSKTEGSKDMKVRVGVFWSLYCLSGEFAGYRCSPYHSWGISLSPCPPQSVPSDCKSCSASDTLLYGQIDLAVFLPSVSIIPLVHFASIPTVWSSYHTAAHPVTTHSQVLGPPVKDFGYSLSVVSISTGPLDIN